MSSSSGVALTSARHVGVGAAATGVVAAVISLARLWWGNSQAITQNLWAEDGLFPLCIHKADFWECTTQPFAGYLLFTPRVLAWPTSVLPWEWWALSANLIAAALAAGAAAFVVVVLRGAGLGWFVTVVVALLPVISPMAGLEAINSVGSSYMLLLFVSALALLFAPMRGRAWTGGIAVLLLVTALTIPSAAVLLAVLAVQWARRLVTPLVGFIWVAALGVGLIAQAIVAVTAETRRAFLLSWESLNNWADAVPISIFTYWPGLSLGEYSFFTNFSLAPVAITGWLFVLVLFGLGLWRLVAGWARPGSHDAAVGLLFLSGLAFGFIPSAIGFANNRYFVVPLLLWATAALVWIAPVIQRARPWVLALVVAVVAVLWWPAFPASEYRSMPAPPWQEETARVEAKCLTDLALVERPIFSPFWPPNWGDGLDEPTHPNIPCTTVFRWIS